MRIHLGFWQQFGEQKSRKTKLKFHNAIIRQDYIGACLFYTLLTGELTKLTLHQVFFDSLKLTSWPLLSFYKPKEAYYADLFRFLATMWKTKVAKD